MATTAQAGKQVRRSSAVREPALVDVPTRTMAVVHTVGDPGVVASEALRVLYASAYALMFDLAGHGVHYSIEPLRARWPNAQLAPKDGWIGVWGLPVPDATASMPRLSEDIDVGLEQWGGGRVAQILHVGSFDREPLTIGRLLEFIDTNGFEIAGPHEEEYLTPPGAAVQRTMIRYPVRPKGGKE